MHGRFSRRALAVMPGILLARQGTDSAIEPVPPWFGAPIGWPDRRSGEGFMIEHGFQCENSWFTPGWWHTGEDWYAIEGDTAGAEVRAVAPGEVVYADYDYPGRVVIVQHADDLYSVYGHLDYALAVRVGQAVETGTVLGAVLQQALTRSYRQAPSHIHFELRRFLIRDDVNGASPGFGVRCGYQCPPGPGYWPQSAPDLPVDLQWLHPTHLRLMLGREAFSGSLEVQPQAVSTAAAFDLHASPGGEVTGSLEATEGLPIAVVDLDVGDPESRETSAEGYRAWALVETGDGSGWIQLAVPSDVETGTDDRPSSVEFPFLVSAGMG